MVGGPGGRDEALDQVQAERDALAGKTSKQTKDVRAKTGRAANEQPKKGRKKGKKGGDDEEVGDLDDFSEDEKPKAKAKAPLFDTKPETKRRPVLMSLDLGTQRTLQAVAAECAREVAMEIPEEEPAPAEPTGLLARLLKQRGEDASGGMSSVDFFSMTSSPVPKPAPPAEPAEPAEEPVGTGAKGLKRGKAVPEAAPAAKKTRGKKAAD